MICFCGYLELSVAHGVLVAMGCWGSYITCGGLLSSIDNALSGRFCRFCDSAVAAADACGLAGVFLSQCLLPFSSLMHSLSLMFRYTNTKLQIHSDIFVEKKNCYNTEQMFITFVFPCP